MTTPTAAWPWPPPRTLLFVPADRAGELLPKALRSGADALILDLEDGIAPAAKEAAREAAATILRNQPSKTPILVRVNGIATAWHEADMTLVRVAQPAAVIIPKADRPRELAYMTAAAMPPLVPLVESAAGVVEAVGICRVPGVIGVAFGAIDFAASLTAGAGPAPALVDHARLHVALVAAAAGIWAIDGPCIELDQPEVLEAEARAAREAGCSGKLIIHPAQVATVHEAFRPASNEVARAQRVVEAYDRMSQRGEGVMRLDGRMLDAAVAAAARRTIDADERDR